MEIIMKFQLSTYALDGRVHEETPTKVLIPLDDMHVKTVISLAYLLQKFCEKIYWQIMFLKIFTNLLLMYKKEYKNFTWGWGGDHNSRVVISCS